MEQKGVSRYDVGPTMWPWALTLTLDFQGQILEKPYPRNRRTDWHGTKGIWIDRKPDPALWLWTLTSTVTLTLDFKGQILKILYLRNRRADWHRIKVMWVDRMLDPLCDRHLGFQGQILKKLYLWNGRVDWHGTKVMWVDKMLNPLCDLELWYWTWTFKVKLWNSHIPRMGGQIDMEWKGCELIGCWTHCVTLTFNLTHDLSLGFSRLSSHISGIGGSIYLEWQGCESGMMLDLYGTLDLQYGLARGLQHIPYILAK